MTEKSDKNRDLPRGGKSVLGSKQEFRKDETPDAGQDAGRDERAKDDIGHMGEASRQNRTAKDVR